jgi:hypothetical protein
VEFQVGLKFKIQFTCIKNIFFARALFSNLKVLNTSIVEKSLNNVFQGICVYHRSISTFLGLEIDFDTAPKRTKQGIEDTTIIRTRTTTSKLNVEDKN